MFPVALNSTRLLFLQRCRMQPDRYFMCMPSTGPTERFFFYASWNITLHRYHNSWKPDSWTKTGEKYKGSEHEKKTADTRDKYCDLTTTSAHPEEKERRGRVNNETATTRATDNLLDTQMLFFCTHNDPVKEICNVALTCRAIGSAPVP